MSLSVLKWICPPSASTLRYSLRKLPWVSRRFLLVALGPRVAEVDVQPVHLAGGKHVRQQRRVAVHEEHVAAVRPPCARSMATTMASGTFSTAMSSTSGSGGGRVHGEAALAAAQLHPQLPGIGHQRPPLATHGEGIADETAAAGLHPGQQILLFSHTHGAELPPVCGEYRSPIIPYFPATCKPQIPQVSRNFLEGACRRLTLQNCAKNGTQLL